MARELVLSPPAITPASPATLPVLHPLGDGRAAIIRPARDTDRALYAAAVASLSERSRYQRFFTLNPLARERDLDRLMDLRADRQAVWLAIDDQSGTGLGAARWALSAPGVAEVAFAVLDAEQGKGLGGALLDRTILGARQAGITTLVAISLSENRAAAGLLSSRGLSVEDVSHGVSSWRLALRAS